MSVFGFLILEQVSSLFKFIQYPQHMHTSCTMKPLIIKMTTFAVGIVGKQIN